MKKKEKKMSLPLRSLKIAKGVVDTGQAIMKDLESSLRCADTDSEAAFYERLRTFIGSFYPNYGSGSERVEISVTGMRPIMEIRLINEQDGKTLASSQINYSWDDLPDKVRKSLILKKKYEETFSGGAS